MLLNNILWAVTVFIAIIVWTRTRDSSWIFIVLSVITFYGGVIYKTLLFFGIIIPGKVVYKNIDILEIMAQTIPVLFLIIALSIKGIRNSGR